MAKDREDQDQQVKTEAKEDQKEEIKDEAVETTEEVDGEEERDPEELQQKIDELEAEIAALKKENEQYRNKLQRSKADFANYRRRVTEEKFGLCRKYKKEVIIEILPVLDNFERALDSCEEKDEFYQGIEMIHKQITSVLEQEGVGRIATEEEEFDPEYHEAVEQVETDEYESGTIIEEMQKGYTFQDEVLRPALVKVAK